MRLFAFLEAWVQLVFVRREPVRAQDGFLQDEFLIEFRKRGVAELRKHHKVAAARSQPRQSGRIEAVTALSKLNDRYLELAYGLC
jgi:hypothetical protein